MIYLVCQSDGEAEVFFSATLSANVLVVSGCIRMLYPYLSLIFTRPITELASVALCWAFTKQPSGVCK